MRSRKVLVLNANYTPLQVISWQDAMTLLHKEHKQGEVHIVKYYETEIIKTSSGDIPAPAIIAIAGYVDVGNIDVKLSKKNIIIRDNRRCQYCGDMLGRTNSTMDHVRPRSRFRNKGEAHKWDNLVLACIPCNRRKADRPLDSTDMVLLKQPAQPNYQSKYVYGLAPWDRTPQEWKDFV